MQTIGRLLRQSRKKKKISIAKLSEITKIKARYLQALEKEEWQALPNFAVTQGFVRNITGVLGADADTAIALLRRDYEERYDKKNTIRNRTILWTPRTTTIAIVLFISAIVGFYLFSQYKTFVAPPPLTVNEIEKGANGIKLSGKTTSEAQILVNNEPLLTDKDGNFEITLTNINSGEKVTVESRSRSGKSTKKEITIP